jgi:hypothetical protein
LRNKIKNFKIGKPYGMHGKKKNSYKAMVQKLKKEASLEDLGIG